MMKKRVQEFDGNREPMYREPQVDIHTALKNAHDDTDRLRDRRDFFKRRSEDLEDELEHARVRNGQLEAMLTDEKERVAQTKRSANQMQSAMDNRETFLGEQTADLEVCGTFDKLLKGIKTWSTSFVGGEGDLFKEAKLSEYQRVAPIVSELQPLVKMTTNKRQKRLFVRGWTAYVMCSKLFRTLDLPPAESGKDVWVRQALADNFQTLENNLWFTGQWSSRYGCYLY